MVEVDPIHHDLLDGDPVWRRRAVIYLLITPLYTYPGLLHQRWVGFE